VDEQSILVRTSSVSPSLIPIWLILVSFCPKGYRDKEEFTAVR
jgi:hypothetical protein